MVPITVACKNMKTNMNCKYISKNFLLYYLTLSQFMMIG
ncbi:hypothetical protein BRARA_G02999 [Brassica rapa]|uniref:Uncharacterized protein n=1 Tax=Brassica campestris TaxID=3711 RepID=A0A397YQR5_BRACM|nr:hypothetical protein BRARA_G02999 [Brassica rapa]